VFIKKVIKGIRKDRPFGEVIAKRIFTDKMNLKELHKQVCAYYKKREKGEEGNALAKEMQRMFIYLSKEYTSAFNSEISEKVGGISPSAITHAYKRTKNEMGGGKKLQKRWKTEGWNFLKSTFLRLSMNKIDKDIIQRLILFSTNP
jgi:chromosomal replication initiation ATPase DnaA